MLTAFHNGSNYDYHFIIKELAEEFKKQLIYLGENTQKYITFLVPIEKEVTRIDKKWRNYKKTCQFQFQFIDTARFMASSLSNLINNLSKGIQKVKCKYGHDEKTNVKLAELNINIAPSFLNTQTLKMI